MGDMATADKVVTRKRQRGLPMPADFHTVCLGMGIDALREHYGASYFRVHQWLNELPADVVAKRAEYIKAGRKPNDWAGPRPVPRVDFVTQSDNAFRAMARRGSEALAEAHFRWLERREQGLAK